MRLRLEDQGEGWPPDAPRSLVGQVTGQVAVAMQEPYLRVEFDAPLELQERGAVTPSGLHLVTYVGAWVRSRWIGHSIGPAEPVSTFVWLITQGSPAAEPPGREQPPRLWAWCTVLDGSGST